MHRRKIIPPPQQPPGIPPSRTGRSLTSLKFSSARCLFPTALSVIFKLEAHAVSFVESTNAGSFERGRVNEDILAALAALSLANSEVNTVSDKAAIKLERGTKRTCQNPECREHL